MPRQSVCGCTGGATMKVIAASSLEAAFSASFPAAHHDVRPPTIPIDYSSTTTIPRLNFRFPERTVTMQETRGRVPRGAPWRKNQNGRRSFEGAPGHYGDRILR
jgi:hypothetical protein